MLSTIFVPALLGLALCVYLGYCAEPILPAALQPERAVLRPLLGCMILLLFVTPLTVALPVTPPHATLALGVLSLPVFGWRVWRWRTERSQPSAANAAPRWFVLGVWACAVLAFGLAVLPLLRWHTSLPIGSNWDAAEFYIPLGRALQLRAQRDLASLGPNPVITIVTTPPVAGRVHAFSYLHAVLSSASGVEPMTSFAPVMALVLALQPLALAVLARVGGLGRVAALGAALLIALAWLPLWVTYNSFSSHLLALALLPAAVAMSLVALQIDGWRALVTGAVGAAGLATAYYPALSMYVLLLIPVGLYRGWQALRSHTTRRWLLRVGGLAALAFGLSAPVQFYFFARSGYLQEMLRGATGFNVTRFMGWADAVGLQATFRDEGPAGPRAWVLLGLCVAALLLGAAIWSRRVPLLVALLVGVAGYQAYTAAQAYHYGFYKGITFALPFGLVLIASGAAWLWQRMPVRFGTAGRVVIGLGVLVFASRTAWTTWDVQQRYWQAGPQLWRAAEARVTSVRSQIPPEASVLVVPPGDRSPVFASLLSYALLGHSLSGQIPTGYLRFEQPALQPPRMALLAEAVNPADHGFAASDLRWAEAGMRLYGADPSVIMHRSLGNGGRYPTLTPGAQLLLALGSNQIALPTEAAPAVSAETGTLSLALASFGPTTVTLEHAGGTDRYPIAAGMTSLTSSALPLRGNVVVRNQGSEPIYLWWAELAYPSRAAGAAPRPEVFVQTVPGPVNATPSVTTSLRLHTRPLPTAQQKLTGILTLSYTPPDEQNAQEIGQWVFFPSGGLPWEIGFDPLQQQATLRLGDQPAELFGTAQAAGDGSYQLTLLLANNAQVAYATPLWTWQRQGTTILDRAPDSVIFDVVPLPRGATEYALTSADERLRLDSYTFAQTTVQQGGDLRLSLVWQSLQKINTDLRMRVQLRDATGTVVAEDVQPLGASQHPTTTWQEGEIAEHAVQLSVPRTATPGPATITVAILDAADSVQPFDPAQPFAPTVQITP